MNERKKKGIIPMVVGELLSARSATKKRLKLEKDENKKKVLEGFQLAFKLKLLLSFPSFIIEKDISIDALSFITKLSLL